MEKPLGVYIHIPFCASRCSYCDFCSMAGGEKLFGAYQDAVEEHISEAAAQMSSCYVDSVYFGGGTPSYYGAKRIRSILNTLKRTVGVLKSSEITVECNPDSMVKRDLDILRKEGVNRLSVGVQSANGDLLKLIGRRHSFQQARNAIALARDCGFDNISIDLIYGLPSQSRKDWADTLNRSLELRPEHISCYGLKLEPGTKMYSDFAGVPILPDDDEQADMYLYTVETLAKYGYPQYEISNFAAAGYESRHNLKYWELNDYIGFGASAHSSVDNLRYSFISDIEGYIEGIKNGTRIIDEYEEISKLDRVSEYIMLGMRTVKGISGDEYYKKYRRNFSVVEEVLKDFGQKGWALTENGRWFFTPSGFLLSNTLISAMLEAQSYQKLGGTPWIQQYNVPSEGIKLPSNSNKIYISDYN